MTTPKGPARRTRKGPQRPPSKRVAGKRVEKHIELLDAFLSGKDFPTIAKQQGYHDRSNAFRAVKAALQQRARERADLADQALEMVLGRYDKLLDVHMRIGLDDKHPLDAARSAQVVLQICDRMVKLLGLEESTKIDVTVVQADDVDAEISKLAAALAGKARAEGADLNVPIIEQMIEQGRQP